MASELLDIRVEVNRDVKNVEIDVNRNWKTVEMAVEKGGKSYPPYAGPYIVDASFYYDTRLNTYGKSMTDDVTVNKVPVVETSNPQGGKTIYIGA